MGQFGSLSPTFRLGSNHRVIGAVLINTQGSKVGSAVRIYNYLKHTKGNEFALGYFRKWILGPNIILNGVIVNP